MVNIAVRFKMVAAAFDEVAKARSCESSGSEHSADLSDLVNSFLEKEIIEHRKCEEVDQDIDGIEINDDEIESNCPDLEFQDSLKNIFILENDDVKLSIHAAVDKALREVGGNKNLLTDFNRWLMARLRHSGFDAGLCKSKWEKNGLRPPGNYEYIDINTNGTRYIIEVFLAGKFTIARPTSSYASQLETFPPIYVGKPEELKQVVRLMCTAIRKSMKSGDIHVPPWRRLSYYQAKWFGSYKRTTNEISSRKVLPEISFYCREDFASKAGVRIGNLALVFNQDKMLL